MCNIKYEYLTANLLECHLTESCEFFQPQPCEGQGKDLLPLEGTLFLEKGGLYHTPINAGRGHFWLLSPSFGLKMIYWLLRELIGWPYCSQA